MTRRKISKKAKGVYVLLFFLVISILIVRVYLHKAKNTVQNIPNNTYVVINNIHILYIHIF